MTSLASFPEDIVKYRTFGSTGLRVSELGFGCGAGGGLFVRGRYPEVRKAVARALELGITYFDTAPSYGQGQSEVNLGAVLRELGSDALVGTKVRLQPANLTRIGPAIAHSVEASLKRLGRERIDLLQLHVWTGSWAAADEWKVAVRNLKEQGKIAAFGLSLNFPFPAAEPEYAQKATQTELVDSCMVVYSIYEQQPKDELFPLALENGVGIIARCPLDEGALSGKITLETTFPEGDWRNDYFRGDRRREVCERADALQWLVRGDVETLAEAALRSHSASRPSRPSSSG